VSLPGLDALYPSLDALYLDLDGNPELSSREEKTSAKLAARLRALGKGGPDAQHCCCIEDHVPKL
jgi:hypothetical protein